MLKRVGGEINPEGAVTTIDEAEFPVPFPPGLEFNSPVQCCSISIILSCEDK